MRIAAHNGARIWGGAERATVALLRGLSDRGHDVLLLCNDDLVRQESHARGVAAELCPIGGDIAVHDALRLAGALRRYKPHAFIIGTWKKLFHAGLGATLAKVPQTVARVGLESDTARSAKYRFALRRWIDGVAVNSERMIAPFAELDGFGAGKVRLIHNGVRAPAPTAEAGVVRRELGIGDDAFVVGTVARLASQKRLDRLLNALAQTDKSVHCIIAGDGSERASLALHVSRAGLSRRVHFLGNREDTRSVLDALDVFVISSDREGLSNSMLEAMSVGLPVISTPVSGASDALSGDEPAGIVTGFDAGDIAQAIERLRTNPATRAEMGRAARRTAESKFSFEGMLDRWETFLEGAPAR